MHNLFFFILSSDNDILNKIIGDNMIFSIDRFHRKQEHDFGLDGWGVNDTPEERLSQEEKLKLIKEMKALEKKASMLKGQRCNCFHSDSFSDLGLENTCSYH